MPPRHRAVAKNVSSIGDLQLDNIAERRKAFGRLDTALKQDGRQDVYAAHAQACSENRRRAFLDDWIMDPTFSKCILTWSHEVRHTVETGDDGEVVSWSRLVVLEGITGANELKDKLEKTTDKYGRPAYKYLRQVTSDKTGTVDAQKLHGSIELTEPQARAAPVAMTQLQSGDAPTRKLKRKTPATSTTGLTPEQEAQRKAKLDMKERVAKITGARKKSHEKRVLGLKTMHEIETSSSPMVTLVRSELEKATKIICDLDVELEAAMVDDSKALPAELFSSLDGAATMIDDQVKIAAVLKS